VPTWEYVVLSFDFAERWRPKRQAEEIRKFQDRLNELGAQGWEMVAYESVPMTGAFTGNLKGHAYLLFMKRPRS
jgi:Domain of unknown function (DUF4177)